MCMADALTKLPKELTCLNDESISIEKKNCHILAPINLDLIEFGTPMGEVAIIKENLELYWRIPILNFISNGKLPWEKTQAH